MTEQNKSAQKSILGLELPTDPRWVNLAAMSLQHVLSDHAYCEQKAAISCISLIQYYSGKTELVDELSPVVTEEWGHFRLVLAELRKRNLQLERQRKDDYVNKLLQFKTKGWHRRWPVVRPVADNGVSGARSCERFKRLSEGLPDLYLQQFYRRFMESEAGHYALFIQLAELYIEKVKVRLRWQQWLTYESEVMKELTIRGDRMH